MNSSGPTQFPSIPGQSPRTETAPEPGARIVSLPKEIRTLKQVLHLKGQVVQQSPDGTARIRTDEGEIEVRLPPKQAAQIKPGDRVEIDIPPGDPPQSAKVSRETPEQDAPRPIPRTVHTPLNIEVRPPDAPPPPAPEQPIVRLEPLPRDTAESFFTQPIEIIVSTITNRFDFKVNAIAVEVQDNIAEQILNIALQAPVKSPEVLILPAPHTEAPAADVVPASAPKLPLAVFTTISPPEFIAPAPQHPAQIFLTPPKADSLFVATEGLAPALATLPPGILSPETTIAPGQIEKLLIQSSPSAFLLPLEAPVATPALTIPAPGAALAIGKTPAPFVFTPPEKAQISILQPPAGEIVTPQALQPGTLPPEIIPEEKTALPKILLKGAEQPLILQNLKAGEIPAVVTAITPQKLPVISVLVPQTGEQLFFVMHMPPEGMVPGTQISLLPQVPLAAGTPVTASVSMNTPMPSYFLAPEPWPLMNEIFMTLQQTLPQAAQTLANITPSPANPAQMGPAVLFFLAAVRGGDLTQWMGERATDAVRRAGRSGMMARLGQEGALLNRMTSESASQEWRALMVPLYWENQMHKMALYYKQDNSGQEDKGQKGKQMRFIFDLKLDAMGKVQLDGLFRPGRLDLIVRTESPFSPPMQADMRRVYVSALGQTSVTGELSFQNRPDQWVTVKPEARNLTFSA